jgi:B12-binding domain/radical SAM domain protein of rhizo-twelve system
MRVALVNPAWRFDGSIYFGCREPHLPLEFGYAKQMLEAAGHEAAIVDGQLDGLGRDEIRARVAALQPDMTVVTTAPSYLFWRCAQPELRVPQLAVRDLREVGGTMVAIGPHGSTTPKAALEKLGVDAVVIGESEEILVRLAGTPRAEWRKVPSLAWCGEDGRVRVQGGPHASDMAKLPALRWPDAYVRRHAHHHHRFDGGIAGPGAEMETSRGCPYSCTFCAKEKFRDK